MQLTAVLSISRKYVMIKKTYFVAVFLGFITCNKNASRVTDDNVHTTGSPFAPAQTQAIPEALVRANQIYSQRCATCHGSDGSGNGPAAPILNPKPHSFTDAAWQIGVTDAAIAKIIVGGGPAVNKSPQMPPNPDLNNEPKIVAALVQKIRTFAKQAP